MSDAIRRAGWEANGDDDVLLTNFVTCHRHGVGNRYQGRPICAGCVADGTITAAQLADPPPGPTPLSEKQIEFNRIRDEKLAMERREEDLRRREIDFAIATRDVAALERLGAGQKAIDLASGTLDDAAPGEIGLDVDSEPIDSGARLAVEASGRQADGLAEHAARPVPRPSGDDPLAVFNRAAIGALVGAVGGGDGVGAAGEQFRTPGVDWP